MAMNKAEQAEMAALKRELALAWPRFPRPEPMTAAEIERAMTADYATSYGTRKVAVVWFASASRGEATKGWTDGSNRGWGADARNGSQSAARCYPTRQDALEAMVWATADECATRMAQALSALAADEGGAS